MPNFDIFYPSGTTTMRISEKLKLVKFCKNFSQHNFEKLIRILKFILQWVYDRFNLWEY